MSTSVLDSPLEQLPGFRRRFRITPGEGRVQSEVEDDFHCMSVIVHHDGVTATAIEPEMRRAPWNTCPGAEEQLRQTFTGVALSEFTARGDKTANCTHLHDLALMAAAHAFDDKPSIFDLLVSDPVDGIRRAEVRCDGKSLLGWSVEGFNIVQPSHLAGMTLDNMRTWISSLDPTLQEAARLLRWGNMVANGRIIPLDQQSDATKMPPNCFTYQPHRAVVAERVGMIRDFGAGAAQPLDDNRQQPVRYT
jgi:Protein of unknown function (DUF2889)